MASRLTGVLALVACCCIGCSVDDVPPAPARTPAGTIEEPISVQMLRVRPELKSQRFSNVLNFENPTDTVFLSGTGLVSRIDETRAHTGRGSAQLAGGSGKLAVKLSSLLGSRRFPGEWTLLGGYFWSDRPARVTLTCEVAGAVIARETTTLRPGQWTAAMVDLANPLTMPKSGENDTVLSFEIDAPATVWCDDVILIDNTHWVLGGPETQSDFMLCRRGFSYLCDSRGRFNLNLPAAEFNPAGWKIEEASPLRLRLNSTGSDKSLTLYPDGRSFWDGRFRALSDPLRSEPLWAQQQASPAQIQVPQPMGRLNRNSIGDENNDGYNELRGAYPILATGPRLEISIVPRSVPVLHPVLEISGLPPGNALVTVEGSLVETTARLEDGTLLVELPLRIDRAVMVNVRIQ